MITDEMVEDFQAACEGELDGLIVPPDAARKILAHIFRDELAIRRAALGEVVEMLEAYITAIARDVQDRKRHAAPGDCDIEWRLKNMGLATELSHAIRALAEREAP